MVNATLFVLECLQIGQRLRSSHLDLTHHVEVAILKQEFHKRQTFEDSSIFVLRCFHLENQMIHYLDAIWPMRCIRQFQQLVI